MEFYDRCTQGVPLSTVSTYGIGGPAQWFFRAEKTEDLQEALRFVYKEHCPFIVVGHGSNCLFPDEGFSGLVIHNRVDSFQDRGNGLFEVGGGFGFPALGARTAREGWGGLEFAVGIPGTVGGAVFMNAGSHKSQVADTLTWVEYVDEEGETVRLTKENLKFGYRFSSFQSRHGVIARVGFQLKKDDGAVERQREMVEYRKRTQPLHEKSAGCVFRNPPGATAGGLIEQSGLKGKRIGGAEVSSLHANFIVTSEGATARDVIDLMHHIQDVVLETKGVRLESEIRIIQSNI